MSQARILALLFAMVCVGALLLYRQATTDAPEMPRSEGIDVPQNAPTGPVGLPAFTPTQTPPQEFTDDDTGVTWEEPYERRVYSKRPGSGGSPDTSAKAQTLKPKITTRTFSIIRLDVKPKVNACADKFRDLLGRGSHLRVLMPISVEEEVALVGELDLRSEAVPPELLECITQSLRDLEISVPEAEDASDYPISIDFDFSAP